MKLESGRSLVVVNKKSGNGQAEFLAEKIEAEFGISAISLDELLGPKGEDNHSRLELELEKISNLFVLGGDGSTFSLLQILLKKDLGKQVVVTPLGLGGENVLAKKAGIYGRVLPSIKKILNGDYEKIQAKPLSVSDNIKMGQESEMPFLWSVHAGFSSAVLYEIEQLRNMNTKDFRRRYQGTLSALLDIRNQDKTSVSYGDNKTDVVDFGVISSTIPFWTSKIEIPTYQEQVAILHTIEGKKQLQDDPVGFSSRLLLEMITLKLGIRMNRRIVRHQILKPGFKVGVQTESKIIAIDSELHNKGSVTVSDKSDFPGNGLVYISQVSLSKK